MSAEKVEKLQQDEGTGKSSRDRSTIAFPYLDLDDAVEIAQTIHNNAGTACTVEQLAGFLNQSARGGGFRIRILSAKTYGLIENPRGQVSLTDIGKKMVDQAQEQAARVHAFFNVPLFKAVHDKFKGNVLPPKAALTREIQGMGVASGQAERARQLLEKSAEQAGFFAHGRDRLVEPVVRGGGRIEAAPQKEQEKGNGHGGGGGQYHPFIEGLLQKLPVPETDWPYEARVKWLQTAAHIFDLLYASDGAAVVNIELKK